MLKTDRYINPLTKKLDLPEIGNKAHSLLFLQRHKFRIPVSYILSSHAFDHYQEDGQPVIEQLRKELSELPDLAYAIRSSTNIEDTEIYSFAGQFITLINIRGIDKILSSIEEVWKSTFPESLNDYQIKASFSGDSVKCPVIIQEMVNSMISGVSFSKNPVTNLSEIVIEAIAGNNEDLVQNGVTPFRWRYKGNYLLEGPEDFHSLNIIKKVAEDTVALNRLYKKHVDIEWAFDGTDIYYLQIRSVTGNDQVRVYSNRMAREMLPGQVKPLVWSVNIPMVNGTWIQLLSEIIGKLKVRPEDLAKSFYYRVYFNMEALGKLFNRFGLPVESLENMMLDDKSMKPEFRPSIKTLRHTFRILKFIFKKAHFEPFFLKEYDELEKRFSTLKWKIEQCNFIEDYPGLYQELFHEGRRIAYLNIVAPLLMQIYNRRLKNKLARISIDYDLLNFNKDFPLLAEITPLIAMNRLKAKIEELPEEMRNNFNSLKSQEDNRDVVDIIEDFERFRKQFGHLSNSGTDFSVAKWEEDPELMFKMVVETPHITYNKELISFSEVTYSKLKYPGLRSLYYKAGKFKVYREQVSSLYIFGYGLFRTLFLGVGKEFVNKGIIERKEDIFYLSITEVDEIVAAFGSSVVKKYIDEVIIRKKEMAESKDLLLPSVIFGDEAPIVESDSIKNMKGVGTSPGVYRGRTKIVSKFSDFSIVNRGEVIIIPFSDISWTPVLCKAGAIVAESGGMLSHFSIIAREMGIPSLASVENACALKDNMLVTVDGSNGILTVHDYE